MGATATSSAFQLPTNGSLNQRVPANFAIPHSEIAKHVMRLTPQLPVQQTLYFELGVAQGGLNRLVSQPDGL